MIRVAEEKARKVEEKIPLKEEIREEHFIADTTSAIIGLTGKILRAINPAWKISKNGEIALALFLLTTGLIISVGGWPSLDFQPWLKMYWGVPLVFLLYFLVDVGQNIEKINRFFKKIQQSTEFEFSKIIGNRVNLDELEILLLTMSFSLGQIEEIIEHLKKRGQFTPNAQDYLLSNRAHPKSMHASSLMTSDCMKTVPCYKLCHFQASRRPEVLSTCVAILLQ